MAQSLLNLKIMSKNLTLISRAMPLALLGTLIPILTGCGGAIQPVIPMALEQSYPFSSSSSEDPSKGLNSDFSCPENPNILPDDDEKLDGTGRYSVCHNKSSQAEILIHGEGQIGESICIYPAQVIDSQHVYVKPDLQTGGPWHQCITIASTGVYANFASIEYNAVFIVESTDEKQMTRCLIGGNYYYCPKYSFGRFR